MKIEGIILLGFVCLMFSGLIFAIIDICYKLPQAAENANQICQEQGYDYYEKFNRIGFLSTIPVAIRCKYVDNYLDIDLEKIGNNLVTTKE